MTGRSLHLLSELGLFSELSGLILRVTMGEFSLIRKPLESPWDELPKRGLWRFRCSQWMFPEGVSPLSPEVLFQASQLALAGDEGVTPGRLAAGELAAGADGMRKVTTDLCLSRCSRAEAPGSGGNGS